MTVKSLLGKEMSRYYLMIILVIFWAGCKKSEPQGSKADNTVAGMEKYEYICSDGGPFLVIPKSLSSNWKGHLINILNPLDPKTDYGRACSVKGKWGLISVGKGSALVLADPPMVSWSYSEGGKCIDIYVLQLWNNLDLDSLIDQVQLKTSSTAFTDTETLFEVNDSGLLIMYSGDKAGDPMYGEFHIAVEHGVFGIYEAHYKEKNGEVDIYRLRRQDTQEVKATDN